MKIECCTPDDLEAGIAVVAGDVAGCILAIDGLGHDSGKGGLADPADP